VVKNIFDVKECPDCAGINLVYVESRDQIICKDCGLVYEPLAPESQTVVAVTHAIETKEKEIGTPLAIITAPVVKAKPKVAKKNVKKKIKKIVKKKVVKKKVQKRPSRRPKKAVRAKVKKKPSRKPKKAVIAKVKKKPSRKPKKAEKPARFSFFKRLRRR